MSSDPSDDPSPAPGPEVAPQPTTLPAHDRATADTVVLAAGQLAERPEADRLARAVARTRIGNQLFAKQDQVQLGRYRLLEMVGAGGMGVVWGAWDPELERRVAIKLVKATVPSARDRIQLEGQALAKLSHPNVVTVYDVGVVDEQVYIVMEWVRGENLRAYCRAPRAVRDVVAIYRAAGEGLAAAHAAGLIHRDFKPDNAIRGDDGRVRVLDFGLARNEVRAEAGDSSEDVGGAASPSSDLTRGAGTPRYMPPEQADGGALSPAVDQYAFCVSLREALAGRNADGKEADIPGWLEVILARGAARQASDRFPDMAALLRALSRDPARIWRRRLIAGGVIAAAAGAFAVGSLRASRAQVAPCSGSRAEIAQTFGAPARAALAAHLRSLGPYGAEEAPRVDDALVGYADRWAASHRTACLAHERGELTAQLYERNLGCLARAQVGLATVVDLLGRVPGERLSNALVATRSLPQTERCLSESLASTVESPPPALAAPARALANETARLRVLAQAADPSVEAAAASLVARSEQLGYAPQLARAYLVQGLDLVSRGERARALPVLERAAVTAIDAGDEVGFVEAYAREIYALARARKEALPPDAGAALGAAAYVEHLARRLGPAASFERPLLYNNLGVSRMSAGDKVGAKAWFARAIEEPRTRSGDVELVAAFGNLALNVEEREERDRLFRTERDTLVALLGPNHIRTLEATYKSAVFVAHPADAAAQVREVCKRVEDFHAREAADLLSRCTYELGWLAEERGDRVEARAAMQRVERARRPLAAAYLAALDGDEGRALALAREVAAAGKGVWWEQFYAADGLLFAAERAGHAGHANEAIALARQALATYEPLTIIQQAPYYLRRVMRTRALLARLLAASDRAAAAGFAEKAAAWYREVGGYAAVLAELEAIAPPARAAP